MDILKDPLWQFIILAVIAVIGIVVAVIPLWQKNRKRLSYEIITSNELLTASEELEGHIEIRFNNVPVRNVHLLVVKLTNDGNVPILETDFYESVVFYFGKNTRILSEEIIENSPETFRPTFITDDDSTILEVQPTLMNGHDSFTIKFLLTQYTDGEMKISGRIVGVKEITEEKTRNIWERIRAGTLIVMIVSLLLAVVLPPPTGGFWAMLFFVAMGLSVFFIMVSDKKK